MEIKKIVIIGAGIGGVLSLQLLKKKFKNANFTLIGSNDMFLFTPRLTEIVSKSTPEDLIAIQTDMLKDNNVYVIISEVIKVNLNEKVVHLENNQKMNYDYLVFAQGAKTNFFGSESMERNSLQFKDYKDAIKLRNLILDKVESNDFNKLKVAIIGGGPTGTELSYAIRDLLIHEKDNFPSVDVNNDIEITIYQGGDTLVKGLDPYLIKKAHEEADELNIKIVTNHHVSDIKENEMYFKEGGKEKADIIVWVAGVKPNIIDLEPKLELQRGAIPVSPTLQLIDHRNAFALGDCCLCFDANNEPYPRTAQIAIQQAYIIADNITSLENNNKLKNFDYNTKGTFLALGNNKAAVQAFFIKFNGSLGFKFRELYYKHLFKKLTER